MLDKSSLQAAHKKVKAIFGPCTWLITGQGAIIPATTTKETYEPGDETRTDIATFFNLDPKGVEFVFNLNFLGTLLPTQEFATDLLGQEGASIVNVSSMNAFTPLTKIPAYSGAKAAVSNFTQWLAVHFAGAGIRVNALAPGFLSSNQTGLCCLMNPAHRPARTGKILLQYAHGPFWQTGRTAGWSVIFDR